MAQTIKSVTFVSAAAGGPADPTAERVYIIGETVEIAVDYTDDGNPLSNVGSPTLGIQIGTAALANNRLATCAIASGNNRRLLCSYVIKEGDEASAADGITVLANSLSNAALLPARQYTGTPQQGTEVDGVRLKVEGITAAGRDTDAPGFTVNNTITLTLTFAGEDEVVTNSGAFGVTLVFDNAERPARYISTSGRTVQFSYGVVAGDNAKAFGLRLTNPDALKDENGNIGFSRETGVAAALVDMAAIDRNVNTSGPRVTQILFRGAQADQPDRDSSSSTPPKPVREGWVFFDVFFDEPVVTTDTTLRVTIGQTTVSTDTCLPDDDSEWLRCRLEIGSGWLDKDGLSTPANPLNYGSLEDALGNAAVLHSRPSSFRRLRSILCRQR